MFQRGHENKPVAAVWWAMIGLSSYAGVMEKSVNSTEEQQPCSLANTCSNKQESGKKQTPKPVGGFVLVHAGKPNQFNKG